VGIYLKNIYIALSQFGNTILAGYPDESLSARSYRKREKKYWATAYKYINKLFFWQNDHCYQSYLSELKFRHLPTEYRK
jgi:hypothetical protein